MQSALLLLSIGLWILQACSRVSLFCLLFSIYGMYLFFRFKKIWVLFGWCLLSLYSFSFLLAEPVKAEPGVYKVESISNSYCIAAKDGVKIVIYGLEEASFDALVQVDEVSAISSLNNLNLFSFEKSMQNQGIYYQANLDYENIISQGTSLKARLYLHLKKTPAYLGIFYGLAKQETFFEKSGLSALLILRTFSKYMKGKLDYKLSLLLCFFTGLLYGHFFVYTNALLVYLCFCTSGFFFKERFFRLSFGILLFCFLFPQKAWCFPFVFTVCNQFCSLFFRYELKKSVRILVMMVLQLFYFNSVDWLSLFFFSIMQKLWLLYCLGGMAAAVFGMNYPVFASLLPSITFAWKPGFLFLAVWMLCLYKAAANKSVLKSKLYVAFCTCFLFIAPYCDPFFHVYMLDIGQGDCTLIVEPFLKSAVMIDAAGNLYRNNAEKIIIPFLESLHIQKLDAIVISHADFDHNGALESLQENFDVRTVITDASTPVPVDYPFFHLLQERVAEDENDASLISYFSYDDLRYLWMGDASVAIEAQMIEYYGSLDADILKIGHHGSSTSSSRAFLSWLLPDTALISVGENNRYNHPASSVLERLDALGINTIATKDAGMIHIFSFRKFAWLQSADGQIARIR